MTSQMFYSKTLSQWVLRNTKCSIKYSHFGKFKNMPQVVFFPMGFLVSLGHMGRTSYSAKGMYIGIALISPVHTHSLANARCLPDSWALWEFTHSHYDCFSPWHVCQSAWPNQYYNSTPMLTLHILLPPRSLLFQTQRYMGFF